MGIQNRLPPAPPASRDFQRWEVAGHATGGHHGNRHLGRVDHGWKTEADHGFWSETHNLSRGEFPGQRTGNGCLPPSARATPTSCSWTGCCNSAPASIWGALESDCRQTAASSSFSVLSFRERSTRLCLIHALQDLCFAEGVVGGFRSFVDVFHDVFRSWNAAVIEPEKDI
jgi:hypothetical protein